MGSVFTLRGIVTVLLYALLNLANGQRPDLGMSFNWHPKPLAAPLGDDVNFECSLSLAPERFQWRHRPLGSDKWTPLAARTVNNAGGGGGGAGTRSAVVVSFDNKSKAGDYRCVAFYGSSGLASDPARLTLATMHEFSDKSDIELRVAVGNTVPITCPVPYSVPEAIVQFYKNDKLVQGVELINGRTIAIENAKLSDSAYYYCTANNYITSQTWRSNHMTILSVHANVSQQAPYFLKQSQTEYTVLRGKNVTMECFAAGYPVPRVTWTRLGGTLPSRSIQTKAGLTIINVQPSDRGEYDCAWSNGVSSQPLKSVIILKVAEEPKILKSPKALTFSEGGELELSCSVTGQPEPSIEWLINGETLLPDNNLEIRGSTLFISEVEKKHAGIVQCVASNEYGSDSGYNLLRVNPKQHVSGAATTSESRSEYGFPGSSRHKHTTRGGGRRRNKEVKRKGTVILVPPNQPNVTRLSDVSVMVRWSVPENKGLPIEFFKVQYRQLGPRINGKPGKWMTANTEIPNHVRSFEVTDLQPDNTYRFRIAAVYSNNDNKLSPNSVRFHLNHNGGFESNRMPIPLLTNTEALSYNEVLLVWQNLNKSAKIDGFYVYHRASSSAGEYVKTTVEGKNSTNITISHLQPDTTYEFKVQSFSVDAASEFSQILRQKTKKGPIKEEKKAVDEQVVAENKLKPTDSNRNDNTYEIIGSACGTSALLVIIVLLALCYKRTKNKQSPRESSQTECGKPIANGRVTNGGVTDSKINITSNPLAGLDASDDTIQPKSGQQSSMEMTSFLNGQNNNGNGNGNGNGSGSGSGNDNGNEDSVGIDVDVSRSNEPAAPPHQGSPPNEQPL